MEINFAVFAIGIKTLNTFPTKMCSQLYKDDPYDQHTTVHINYCSCSHKSNDNSSPNHPSGRAIVVLNITVKTVKQY